MVGLLKPRGKVLELHAVGRQYDPYLTPGCVCPCGVAWDAVTVLEQLWSTKLRRTNARRQYRQMPNAVPKHVMLYCRWMFRQQFTNYSDYEMDCYVAMCDNITTVA